MHTALFVFSIVHYYREMMPVARSFRDAGWRVKAIVGWAGATADAAAEQCRAEGFELVAVAPDFLIPGDHPPPAPNSAPAALDNALVAEEDPLDRSRATIRGKMFIQSLFRLNRIRRAGRKLLRRIAPDIAFFGPFHSPDLLHNGLARACRIDHVPLCCLPVSAYLGERNSVLGRFNNLKMGMLSNIIAREYDWLNRAFSKVFPSWTRTHEGHTLFMWDPTLMLASRIMGLLADNPWQKPSEIFDSVYVYSDFSARMLTESSYDPAKIMICGIPLLDSVRNAGDSATIRGGLYSALNLPASEDFILFNVEPAAEHCYATWQDHRARFRALMEILKRTGRFIVLSLHPLCRIEEYQFVEEEFGFVIARDHKIFDLYPYCRFSVSFPCSTNVVAAEFGKRLVIYDFYGMTADDSPRKDLFCLDGALIGYDFASVERAVVKAIAETPDRAVPDLRPARAASHRILEDVAARFSLSSEPRPQAHSPALIKADQQRLHQASRVSL
jgi:hypothetical protein